MQRVRVYRNLAHGCLSVQAYRPGIGWRVAYHCQSISLVNASFCVYEAGRQRVLRDKRKNVHAFIVGTVSAQGALPLGVPVRYNPYKAEYFHRIDTCEPVHSAHFVTIGKEGIFAEL